MCLVAKPIVDGLERELAGDATVIRVDVMSSMGRTLASEYGVAALPTLLVFDGAGNIVLRDGGPPNKHRVIQAVVESTP